MCARKSCECVCVRCLCCETNEKKKKIRCCQCEPFLSYLYKCVYPHEHTHTDTSFYFYKNYIYMLQNTSVILWNNKGPRKHTQCEKHIRKHGVLCVCCFVFQKRDSKTCVRITSLHHTIQYWRCSSTITRWASEWVSESMWE